MDEYQQATGASIETTERGAEMILLWISGETIWRCLPATMCSAQKGENMPKKIDPLNRKQYGAVTVMLIVADLKAAVSFYQKAFGFAKSVIMNGPDGKAIHAELKLRNTILMLGPENPRQGARSAKTVGASPVTLYLLTENVDKVVAKAVKLGATAQATVTDMFWGDRCGNLIDPDGYAWMIATHVAEPTPKEMAARMKEMMKQMQAQAVPAASGG